VTAHRLWVGYWQSYRYVEPVRAAVLRALRFPGDVEADVARILRSRDRPVVALHVRRGDFLRPPTSTRAGRLTWSYFETGLRRVAAHSGMATSDLRVLVITDDPDGLRATLPMEAPGELLPEVGRDPLVDMCLIARADHAVLSNSSFGWWGAFLGARPGRLVVAPDPWFVDGRHDPRDLVPPGWVRLPR
jgi:hypothetical protein